MWVVSRSTVPCHGRYKRHCEGAFIAKGAHLQTPKRLQRQVKRAIRMGSLFHLILMGFITLRVDHLPAASDQRCDQVRIV